MPIETGDTVVFEYTGRIVDGTLDEDPVFDTSRESVAEEAGVAPLEPGQEYAPLTVEVGGGQLLDGLRAALIGREQGETFTVTIPPEEAHGEWTEEEVYEYDVEELGEMIGGYTPVEGGTIETEDGRRVEIVEVDDEIARVDFNHPLAGEALEFEIEVVDVR